MATATYKLWVDWLGLGNYAGPDDDISGYFQEAETFAGRDFPSQFVGRAIAGEAQFLLNNETGRFNSFQATSPLAGNLLPRRQVKLEETIGVTTQAIWSGFIDEIEPRIEVGGGHKSLLRCVGPFAVLNKVDVKLATQTNILTGAAVDLVLDAAGWPAGDRLIDAGQTTMERWPLYSGPVNALQALRDIEQSEPGFIRETRDGKVAFEDRHHRLKAPHTSSQVTFDDAEGSVIGYGPIRQANILKQIFNVVEAEVRDFSVGVLAVLWTLQQEPLILPGASRTFIAKYPGPGSATNAVMVDAWTTPVATTDYTANSASGGGGSDLTGDISVAVNKYAREMEIELTNNAAQAAYITFLQARGTPVTENDRVSISKEDAASIATFGRRTHPLPGLFTPFDVAEDYASFLLSLRKDPVPILTIEYNSNRNDSFLSEAQQRAVSDRVTINADASTKLGIGEDFFVESIRHRIAEAGTVHDVVMEVSPAIGFSDFWVLGVSELGVTTRLAY